MDLNKQIEFQPQEGQTRKVISSIYESEVDDLSNLRSSVESRRNDNNQNKYLDTLACLFCYDELTKENLELLKGLNGSKQQELYDSFLHFCSAPFFEF
ncbi:MAG: hypothetical protein NY202_05360 [Mollicutes bacterium UO1]